MKKKVGTILLILVLMFSFMINVHAETKIKEDASTYDGDVYIIGSSKFDSNIIVTGTMASIAGARETYIQYIVNQNFNFRPEDLSIYYYSELDETWSKLPATSNDELEELTPAEVERLTDNLNIYYVNEEEKVLEVPYDTLVEDGYELKFVANDANLNDKVKYENGVLKIPATVKRVDVYATPEGDTEGEEVRLGVVEQTNGEFENAYSMARTYEELMYALSSDTETIRIEENIDLPTALEITRKVTIYLNNANLTVSNDTAGDGVFHVLDGGDLTINGTGIVDGCGNNKWNIVVFAEAGKVTLNGGTYTNKNLVVKPDDTDSDHYDVIYAKGSAQVVINGGRYEGKTPAWLLNLNDSNRDTASIIVNGGVFEGFDPSNNKTEGEGTNYVADGYKVIPYNGEYTVMPLSKTDVVMVGHVAYTSLDDAIKYAKETSVIKLLADIDLPTAVEITKKVTIDLNGHKLSVSKDTAGDGVFHVLDGGDLTINGNGIVDGCGNNKWNIVIFAEAGKVTLNGGTYTNKNLVVKPDDTDSDHYDVIYAKGTAEIVINGGTFEGKTPAWLLNLNDSNRNTASITVTGGEFIGFDPSNNKTEGEGTNYVAEGYKAYNVSGTYVVLPKN